MIHGNDRKLQLQPFAITPEKDVQYWLWELSGMFCHSRKLSYCLEEKFTGLGGSINTTQKPFTERPRERFICRRHVTLASNHDESPHKHIVATVEKHLTSNLEGDGATVTHELLSVKNRIMRLQWAKADQNKTSEEQRKKTVLLFRKPFCFILYFKSPSYFKWIKS